MMPKSMEQQAKTISSSIVPFFSLLVEFIRNQPEEFEIKKWIYGYKRLIYQCL